MTRIKETVMTEMTVITRRAPRRTVILTEFIQKMVTRGPIQLPTSLPPWFRAAKQAASTWKGKFSKNRPLGRFFL